MEECPSFSLGLTQLDTNPEVGFVPTVFDYEEPNFDENRCKYRNNPNKMKGIKKVAAEKSKKAIEESSRKFKKDDTERPGLPKFVYNNIRSTYEEVQSLDLQMIEGFELNDYEFVFSPKTATVRSEILKKAGLLSDASVSQHTKSRRTVRFDSTTVEEQVYQKTPSSILTRTVPTPKIPSSDSERVHAKNTTLSSLNINSDDDPMDGHYFDWNRSPIQEQSEDVEGCCEDIATARLDALVKFVVNQNSASPNIGTPSIVHINKDHMDVERVSADIGPATLKSLVAVVENLKPGSANVGTSTMQVDYSSTLSESAQVELDAILEGIAAPMDDLLIEVIPPCRGSSSCKNPAKRTRMRSKVFMSPYTTEYASGSKAIEDQIGKPKQKFAFDGFLISDNMPRCVIEEYKQFTKTNCFFKNYIVKTYSNYYEDDTDTVITTQQDYAQSVDVVLNEDAITNIIKRYCLPSGLPWHQVNEVYVPVNCNEKFHRVLAVIDLKNRRIRVYDSLSSLRNMESINEINKLAAMLPTYLSDSRFFEEISRTD
ncbi:hypothetical protein BC332_19357 [Capsicum chinense]|nr:hypothetical protein BC332_19357 [Capsicum chinense]